MNKLRGMTVMNKLKVDVDNVEAPLDIERFIKLRSKVVLAKVPCVFVCSMGIRVNGGIKTCTKRVELAADNFTARGENRHRALVDRFVDEVRNQLRNGVEVCQFEITLFDPDNSDVSRDLFCIEVDNERI